MTVAEWAARLATADATLNRETLELFREFSTDMLGYTHSIEHVQSGEMRASTVALGPFPIGNGGLESEIVSGAFYAEAEVSKGGDHDWATRTIAEQQARILQLQLEVEALTTRVITGGGR